MSWMTLPEKINYNTEKHGDLPAISQKNSNGEYGNNLIGLNTVIM